LNSFSVIHKQIEVIQQKISKYPNLQFKSLQNIFQWLLTKIQELTKQLSKFKLKEGALKETVLEIHSSLPPLISKGSKDQLSLSYLLKFSYQNLIKYLNTILYFFDLHKSIELKPMQNIEQIIFYLSDLRINIEQFILKFSPEEM
jgi:hypothetical protein